MIDSFAVGCAGVATPEPVTAARAILGAKRKAAAKVGMSQRSPALTERLANAMIPLVLRV
jgi:hypothetical protein